MQQYAHPSARTRGQFLRAFWSLTRPYWQSSQRGKGLVLLAAVVCLALGLVWLEVQFNAWYKDFYDSLESKNADKFYASLMTFTMIGFGFIVVYVYKLYLQQMLQIEWRTWLTETFLADWLKDRAYYRLELLDGRTDNPDQRIAEDLRLFVDLTLMLSLGLLSALVTLGSFAWILWTLSGPLELPASIPLVGGMVIPGYLVWCAVLYAVFGTAFTHLIGRRLIRLDYDQQRFEADFRYSLVRLRENAEGVALYGGERDENGVFRARFSHVITNWWEIMKKRKQLGWFTYSIDQLAIVFPYVVVAPRYFAGTIALGTLVQTATAFGQVRNALSWFIDAYVRLAEWKATVDRLTGFAEALERARIEAARLDGERLEGAKADALSLEALSVSLPQGKPLLAPTSLELRQGEHVLVTGASGSGKSTLFRALAGIWPYWKGRIMLPRGARLLFLPQKPYFPIGTLKLAVCYPGDAAAVSDDDARAALTAVGLAHLAGELAREDAWGRVLSGGEQQRLAFARSLVNRPDWLFLDEATASLPDDVQAALYRLLRERLPGTTLVSIGHRPELAAFHDRQLAWRGESLAPV
ncbi:MAG: ABC transporter ATP-binding protein/permease [Burkholderiales bacterium]